MTLKSHDKKSLSDIRMTKAYDFLEDARANYKDGRYKTSINRSYYAALNAARAVLILEGSNPETHEGIITMLSLRFIKPKLLPVELLRNLKFYFQEELMLIMETLKPLIKPMLKTQ